MCGIFGYAGSSKDAAKIVFDGLKRVEYRGYDSWGVVVLSQRSKVKGQKLVVEKHVGAIGDLKSASSLVTRYSSLALGHTRWATHGEVTKANAHPHLDCKGQIAIVHNGICENFQELKENFSQEHKLKSRTDSEIIVHLIEEEMRNNNFTTVVWKIFKRLKGLNVIVVVSGDNIVAVKNGSPLVVGIGDGEYFVSS